MNKLTIAELETAIDKLEAHMANKMTPLAQRNISMLLHAATTEWDKRANAYGRSFDWSRLIGEDELPK